MVVSELITLVNVESNEILDEQLEYIQYINAAIDWLTTILVSIKDREVVKNTDIPNLKTVPSDFMGFVPKSGYPIRIINGTFETYDGETVNQVFYISFMVKKKSLMTDYAAYDKQFIDYITEQIKAARGIA